MRVRGERGVTKGRARNSGGHSGGHDAVVADAVDAPEQGELDPAVLRPAHPPRRRTIGREKKEEEKKDENEAPPV